MTFSDNEIQKMQGIFKRLEPTMTMYIQLHDPKQGRRTGISFGFQNRKREWYCLYQNFNPLSPARMKILNQMSKKIPYELHITHPFDDIVRIGWKCPE